MNLVKFEDKNVIRISLQSMVIHKVLYEENITKRCPGL